MAEWPLKVIRVAVGAVLACGALTCSNRAHDPAPNASVEADLKQLQDDVATMKLTVDFLELNRKISNVAFLTPGDDGYSVIKMDLGALTVSLADVAPYANGSRVTLVFGNPLSARVNGLKMAMDWGSVDEKGSPNNLTAHTKELTVAQAIRGGAWTRVPIVLDGVPPANLGFVRLRDVEHTGISLGQ